MVLLIGGRNLAVIVSVSDFIKIHHRIRHESERFKTIAPIKVDPNLPYLFVHQTEIAYVSGQDSKIDMIGLDEMTTCCGVVIRHTGSFAMGAGHFDGQDTRGGIHRLFNGVESLTNDWMLSNNIDRLEESDIQYNYEVTIVGGFDDSGGISNEVVMHVLESLHALYQDLHLKTACVGFINTYREANKPQPRVTGLLCNIKTGQIVPASFSYDGPLVDIRRLRFGMRPPIIMHSIYDPTTEILEIKAFKCDITDRMIDRWLAMDSKTFLAHLSTSPDAESSDYVSNLKKALRFLKDHRDTLFKSGRSYKFTRADGQWKQIEL